MFFYTNRTSYLSQYLQKKLIFKKKKDEIILSLKNNLDKLNSLFRENLRERSLLKLSKKI